MINATILFYEAIDSNKDLTQVIIVTEGVPDHDKHQELLKLAGEVMPGGKARSVENDSAVSVPIGLYLDQPFVF